MSITIHIILTYIVGILFTVARVLYFKYQRRDELATTEEGKGKWHTWGWVMAVCLIIGLVIHAPWKHAVLLGAIQTPLFDMLINKWAMNLSLWYVGKTAKTDKVLGQKKWWIWLGVFIFALLNTFYKQSKNTK